MTSPLLFKIFQTHLYIELHGIFLFERAFHLICHLKTERSMYIDLICDSVCMRCKHHVTMGTVWAHSILFLNFIEASYLSWLYLNKCCCTVEMANIDRFLKQLSLPIFMIFPFEIYVLHDYTYHFS